MAVQYTLKTMAGSEARRASLPARSAPEDILLAQRRLRAKLLDRRSVRYSRARDLAAHMLLHIDDLASCWALATDWLRIELGCHRVDTGFGLSQARDYFPGFAQAKDPNFDVPSFGGRAVDNSDPAMQAMWRDARPIIFADIKYDSRVTPQLRRRMSGAQTKSKIGWALRDEKGAYGLICADWTVHLAPWESGLVECFEQTVADVLGPVIGSSRDICDPEHAGPPLAWPSTLTQSEYEVARLVATGLSYKEIARIRGRSQATIDHQLRSIRRKAGVTSTSTLVSILASSVL